VPGSNGLSFNRGDIVPDNKGRSCNRGVPGSKGRSFDRGDIGPGMAQTGTVAMTTAVV